MEPNEVLTEEKQRKNLLLEKEFKTLSELIETFTETRMQKIKKENKGIRNANRTNIPG